MITEVITVNTIVITDTTEAYYAITNVITVNTIVITLQNVNFILLTTIGDQRSHQWLYHIRHL